MSHPHNLQMTSNQDLNSSPVQPIQTYPHTSQYVDPSLTAIPAEAHNIHLNPAFHQTIRYQPQRPYIPSQNPSSVQNMHNLQQVQALQNVQNMQNVPGMQNVQNLQNVQSVQSMQTMQPFPNQQFYYPQGSLPIQSPEQLQYSQPYQSPFLVPTTLPLHSSSMYIQQDLVPSYYNQQPVSNMSSMNSLGSAPLLSSPVPVYNFPNSQMAGVPPHSPHSSSFPHLAGMSGPHQQRVPASAPASSQQQLVDPLIMPVSSSPFGTPSLSSPTSASSSSTKSSKTRRKSKSSTPQPRKRTTRACDQCNHLRTKCDGKQPCGHCLSVNLECQYLRVPLKRGKASITYLESVKEKKAQEAAKREAEKEGITGGKSSVNGGVDKLAGAPRAAGGALSSMSHPSSNVSPNQTDTQNMYFSQYPSFQ